MGIFRDVSDLILLGTALLGAAVAWVKVIVPVYRWARLRAAERDAINEVLLGRPEVPANPITGEPEQPERLAIGQQVADLAVEVRGLAQKLDEVHHELHPNGGTSMNDAVARTEAGVGEIRVELGGIRDRLRDGDRRFDHQAERLGRIEVVLADELAVATDTLANAAEASKTALRVIDAALQAEPPPDLD